MISVEYISAATPMSVAPEASTGPSGGSARAGQAESRGAGSFSFGDFVDVINPLQHIPGIAEIYRSITNDQISDDARKTGNAIYGFALGGPVGLSAMLAYNAVGDHLQSSPSAGDLTMLADAGEKTIQGSTETPVAPVPTRKPEEQQNEGNTSSNHAGHSLLGENVASAGVSRAPLNLHDILTEAVATASDASEVRKTSSVMETLAAASSVSYADDITAEVGQAPVLPSERGLDRIASHKSNHLSLDVLKALQERHAERTASERS